MKQQDGTFKACALYPNEYFMCNIITQILITLLDVHTRNPLFVWHDVNKKKRRSKLFCLSGHLITVSIVGILLKQEANGKKNFGSVTTILKLHPKIYIRSVKLTWSEHSCWSRKQMSLLTE